MATDIQKQMIEEIGKKYGMTRDERTSMDLRKKEIYKNIFWATKRLIGGEENCMMDCGYEEGDDGYSSYQTLLDAEKMVAWIKSSIKDAIFGDCFEAGVNPLYLKHYRFAGNDFIDRAVRFRVEVEYRVYGVAGWVLGKDIEFKGF